MDIQSIGKFMTENMVFVMMTFAVLLVIMLIMIINLSWKLAYMRKRYRKMMTGVDGDNLERMLIGHIDETKAVAEENERLKEENRRIDALLKTAVTKVSVLRFRAFEDMGSDLSYAVALLDSYDNGVILSSIFGREDSRSYVKPIQGGASSYTLTAEETKALKDAMAKQP